MTDLLYSPHHIGQYSSVKLHRDAAFPLLPSLAASCVVVFLLFEISKLENLAIKLVEIGSEKHKFPNLFLLKRGNLVFNFVISKI
jgi:hypothetical protein